jgi:hypothetical protein
MVGADLDDPLVVKVTTLDGEPVQGEVVQWSAISGGGVVMPEETSTDDQGLATARWTLGPDGFGQQAEALVGGGERATFDALAEPEEWIDVLEITVTVEEVEARLVAHTVLEHRWPATLMLQWYNGCLLTVALFDASAEHVADMTGPSCVWGLVGIPADGSLYQGDWSVDLAILSAGEYEVRFRFSPGLEVNGRATAIPDVAQVVVIE